MKIRQELENNEKLDDIMLIEITKKQRYDIIKSIFNKSKEYLTELIDGNEFTKATCRILPEPQFYVHSILYDPYIEYYTIIDYNIMRDSDATNSLLYSKAFKEDTDPLKTIFSSFDRPISIYTSDLFNLDDNISKIISRSNSCGIATDVKFLTNRLMTAGVVILAAHDLEIRVMNNITSENNK